MSSILVPKSLLLGYGLAVAQGVCVGEIELTQKPKAGSLHACLARPRQDSKLFQRHSFSDLHSFCYIVWDLLHSFLLPARVLDAFKCVNPL